MKLSRSFFVLPLASLALLAGCVASSEPETSVDTAEQAVVDESGALEIPTNDALKLERAEGSETLTLAPSATWKQIAPGVFENGAEEGGSRILMGAEGHQWALDRANEDLSKLRAQPDAEKESVTQLEAQIAELKNTVQNLAAPPVPTPSALSCNLSFYTGPSSPISGSYGAAALAQVSCSGGCQTFTISAQACTNFGCSPVYSSSRFVCSTPWTYGVTMSGSYGAFCSSSATVSPPGLTSSWSGSCG